MELTGKPRVGAVAYSRAFVGIAFRVSADGRKFEYFYIRPTAGRRSGAAESLGAIHLDTPVLPVVKRRENEPYPL